MSEMKQAFSTAGIDPEADLLSACETAVEQAQGDFDSALDLLGALISGDAGLLWCLLGANDEFRRVARPWLSRAAARLRQRDGAGHHVVGAHHLAARADQTAGGQGSFDAQRRGALGEPIGSGHMPAGTHTAGAAPEPSALARPRRHVPPKEPSAEVEALMRQAHNRVAAERSAAWEEIASIPLNGKKAIDFAPPVVMAAVDRIRKFARGKLREANVLEIACQFATDPRRPLREQIDEAFAKQIIQRAEHLHDA